MTNLRKKFNGFKKRVKKNSNKKKAINCISLFENAETENSLKDPVEVFIKAKRITGKEIMRFYITEITGLTEEEFNEHFIKGKDRLKKTEIRNAVKEAVKFKLKCEME